MPSRRNTLRLLCAATPIAAVVNAFAIEPTLLSITRRSLTLPHLPKALNGLRVAHLSDFHFKPRTDDTLMQKVLDAVNKEQVDLIFLTGDFITDDRDIEQDTFPQLLEYIKKLESKHGIYACLGNHDGWHAPREYFQTQLEAVGVRVLINESEILEIDGEQIFIAGTDFVWQGKPDAHQTLTIIPADACIIALVHEPDYFDDMLQVREVDLQLSGHTHGGQCRVPFIGYAPVSVRYGKKYVYGHFANADSQLFVTRGIGTSGLRVRFACPPELAILALHASNKSQT